ncbi:MAG: ferredoxin, partial [Deltaproteobacteria bacterium]
AAAGAVPAEATTAEAAPAEAAPAEAPSPEPDDEPEEPWIDTPLCTSCNDCIQINSRLFVYDSNKQAMIGDPTAGTYEELVRAAEGCPARCIHPGTPLNPNEPGLDALIERAARFR